jgi:hypothetical protein
LNQAFKQAMNTTLPRHRRQLETDFTAQVRSQNCGFYLTPEEAQKLKVEAKALNTTVSCLVREALRKTDIL